MNTAFKAAAETARLGWVMGVMTAVFLLCFMGWSWWAFSRRHRALMEEMGRMPLSNEVDQ
jgi:cbb3-type cytochrome oxidase subunit 3